jgi:hypothetical protein
VPNKPPAVQFMITVLKHHVVFQLVYLCILSIQPVYTVMLKYIQYFILAKCFDYVSHLHSVFEQISYCYITLHSIDPKLVKITVGCGVCHIDTKHVYNTNKILIQERPRNIVATHKFPVIIH